MTCVVWGKYGELYNKIECVLFEIHIHKAHTNVHILYYIRFEAYTNVRIQLNLS
jgi:hypothetical protein